MPIYEYVCQDCGEKYEKFVRTGAGAVEMVCPRCGSRRAEKAFSLFGLGGSAGASKASPAPAAACGPVG